MREPYAGHKKRIQRPGNRRHMMVFVGEGGVRARMSLMEALLHQEPHLNNVASGMARNDAEHV